MSRNQNGLKSIGMILLAGLLLAGLWQFTPLQEYANPNSLAAFIDMIDGHWWTPLAIIPIYLVAHALMFPNMVLNGTVILSFGGGLNGWFYAMFPSLVSGTVFFFAGRYFGTERVQKIESEAFTKITSALCRGGLATVVAVRLVPTGPFSLVNLGAGAIGIKYWHFLLGTFIGMLPGSLTMAFFGTKFGDAIENPSMENIVLLIAILAIGILVIYLGRRFAKKQIKKDKGAS